MNTATPIEMSELSERALLAARTYRATDRIGFLRRNNTVDNWNRWTRRARVARIVAAALEVPVGSVTVTDDPQRKYRTRDGMVPGDLITVTDPASAHQWRFVPDIANPGQAWLLLDSCSKCGAEIPVANVAGLADLGDYLDPDSANWVVDEALDDDLHAPGCLFAASAIDDGSTPGRYLRPLHLDGDHRATT